MDREERAKAWRYSTGSAFLDKAARAEHEPDVCFINLSTTGHTSPLGFCCMLREADNALRVLLDNGADPTKPACENLKGRVLDAFWIAMWYGNIRAFITMLDYAPTTIVTPYGDLNRWVDCYHLRNRSKVTIACILRNMQRDDLIEPVLRRVCAIPLLEWK
jgi:hypothetical protein